MKPRLSRKARVRPDPRDGTPVLLSPERGLRLSETAAAIVALCDGTRSVGEMVDLLASRYSAERSRVDRDVRELLSDLHSRALLEGWEGQRGGGDVDEPEGAPVPGGSHEFSPYTLVAELTHRCPLACPYCSNPLDLVRGPDELPTDGWLRVLEEAKALGVMQVHLTGGEPLARADLETIAGRARALDLYVNLVTSGIPADPGRLERLAPSLDHVQLSVQAADAETCNRVAGLDSFEAKMRMAAAIKALGLPLTLNVVLHRENLDRIDAIVSLAERIGADRLELANVQMIAWANENAAALLPTHAQIERARRVAQLAKPRLAGRMELVFVLPDWHAGRPRGCMDGWGRRFVVVAPDGAVLPCHAARALPLRFDNVREQSLARAWAEAPGMRAYRGEDWMPEPCRTCDRRAIDFGGCRCQAFALTGDPRATDPACSLAPAHEVIRMARARAEIDDPRTPRKWVYRGRDARR